MKKNINLLVILCVALFSLGSCVENDPTIEDFPGKDIDFYYTCPNINYVIKEEISFMNTSLIGSTYEWEFGDGGTSSEKNPIYKYELPGYYTVKLTVDGTRSITKKIMISDIIPIIKINTENGLDNIVYNQTAVAFDVYVDNPEDAEITYNWTFPAGTQGEGIDTNGKSTLKEPNVIFNKFGSQIITLQVSLGEKKLETIVSKVRVNYDKPAKTLYYAVKNGNMMAKKIVDDAPADINYPFDLGYKSGKHVLSMQFSGDWLYAFDAGSKTGYVEKPAGLGDGEIFVISADWKKRESVMENFDGDSFMDFFYGYIDEEAGRIHFLDRRDGIRWIPITTRNAKFDATTNDYWVRNERIGYYGKGISWGNINGPLLKHNGIWYWAKNSTGKGVYRFVESDVDKLDDVPAAGAILTTHGVRAMAINPGEQRIYFADNGFPHGVYCKNLETGQLLANIDKSDTDGEGGTAEDLFVTGMVIDFDGGYLYWAYRGPSPVGNPDEYYAVNPLAKSGIKRIKLSDIDRNCSDKVEYYIEGVEAYGLAIDNTAR